MRARRRACRRAGIALLALSAAAGAAAANAAAAEPAELSIWNRPIAIFRATVADVPPERRAENARARIDALPASAAELPIRVRPASIGGKSGLLLAVGDDVVFGLVPEDLDPESEQSLEQAAAQASSRLTGLLAAKTAQRDLPGLLRSAGLAALALLVFGAGTWMVFRLRRAAIGRLLRILEKKRLTIGGLDLVPTLATVERATFRVLSWLLTLGLAYACLTFIFHQFPLTAPLGERLGNYVVAKLGDAGRAIADAIPSLIGVTLILVVTRALSLWAARLLVEIEHGLRVVPWLAQEQAKATRRIASGIIWMLGIATAYPILPWSGSVAFQGMSVIVGVALSFASGGLINHWVSGLMLLYARSFRPGEFVSIGEVEGVVVEMGALATKLRTMRREIITIPNGAMAAQQIVNYTRLAADQGAVLAIRLAVGYDAPWQRVRGLLLDAAAGAEGIAADPPPRVLVWELGEFAVSYQLHVFLVPGADRISARATLNTRILDAFNAAGVQIMTPHFESQPGRPVIAPMDSGHAT